MCGIVGLVSSCSNGLTNTEMGLFSDMLFLDTVRGFDSTGVFGITNQKNVTIHKEASHGIDFMLKPEYREFKQEMIARGKFVVGHNRSATRGKITDENAHPFWVDDKIVLVQNGTYKGDHKHLKDTNVDSEAVAHVISETPTVEEALKKINASYALVWYNADEGSLHLIRNSERPLWLASFHNTGIMFASEKSFITYAAERSSVQLSAIPEMLPEHTHIVFTLDGKGGYTRSDTKLDAGYSFRQQDQDELDYYGQHYQHHHRLPRTPVANAINSPKYAQRDYRPGGKDDIAATFFEAVATYHPAYLFETQQEATRDMDEVNQAVHMGHHYVELVDYIAANDHADCTAWHVFGVVLNPNQSSDGPTTLVHWIEYGKEEKDILDMCTGTFWKVKLSTMICRTVTKKDGTKLFANTVFASSKEQVHNTTVATQ